MTFEELIRKRLIEYEPITEMLAKYSGIPAIFYQTAPPDNQIRWCNAQYPRIVYTIDMQANQERKCAGTLAIDLLCDESGIMPEDIEPKVKECLKDLLIYPTGNAPYCFAWARTDAFDIPSSEAGMRIIGTEIRFDVVEYTSQETTDPDPIDALNRFIKCAVPEARILWLDGIQPIDKPTLQSPVIYNRIENTELESVTNTVAWMRVRIALHVLCGQPDTRLKYVMAIANELSKAGEIIMIDKSPMRVMRLQVNNKADYLKEGQLFITARYGTLRFRSYSTPINYVDNNSNY